MERVTGIEPVSTDWQPVVIATILYPPVRSAVASKLYTTRLNFQQNLTFL